MVFAVISLIADLDLTLPKKSCVFRLSTVVDNLKKPKKFIGDYRKSGDAVNK